MKFPRFKKKAVSTSARNPRYRIITLENPNSIAAECYRRVKVGLEYAEVDHKVQVIQATSSIQGEGKTTMILNIAATYAEDKKKVLVLDLDWRRPKLHRSFGVENKNGVVDVLAGKIELKDAIKHVEGIPFDCLNRGGKTPNPTSLLASKELSDLIEKLRGMYDIILIDCPPVLAVTDSILVSNLSDGALFVVSQAKSDKQASKDAIKTLRANNVQILGVVMGEVKTKGNAYYKHYYSSYYGDLNKPSSSDK